jgi:hypothetical protein
MRKIIAGLLSFLILNWLLPARAVAQEPDVAPLWLSLAPAVSIPVAESAGYFAVGGDVNLSCSWRLPFLNSLSLRGGL